MAIRGGAYKAIIVLASRCPSEVMYANGSGIEGPLLSRLYRKAEAVDQACLRAQGHPHDYAIRQELLSALEWEDSLHPVHARPLIRDLFREVHDNSTELSSRLAQNNPQVASVPMAEFQTFRQGLSKLLHVLVTRHVT